jgi:hypothetical protein
LSPPDFPFKLICFNRYFINIKYFAMKARIIETIPPIRNLMAMILKPSPCCIGETTLVPIQIQITPKATITIPAAKVA